jgi:hypothetical protein
VFCGGLKVLLCKFKNLREGIGNLLAALAYVFDFKYLSDRIELSMRTNHGLKYLEGAREIRFA